MLWLKDLKLETDYGRKTLDLLIAQYEDLRAQQLNMMKELRALSKNERFEQPLRLLMTIPGIAQVSGLTILSEIDNIARFKDSSHLASFVGLIPMCYSSGEHDGTGILSPLRRERVRCTINGFEVTMIDYKVALFASSERVELTGKSMLFADHYVQDHIVCVLHSDRADAAEVLDCLFDVFLDDSVVLRDTDAFAGQDG